MGVQEGVMGQNQPFPIAQLVKTSHLPHPCFLCYPVVMDLKSFFQYGVGLNKSEFIISPSTIQTPQGTLYTYQALVELTGTTRNNIYQRLKKRGIKPMRCRGVAFFTPSEVRDLIAPLRRR